jgi:thioredoxin-like negative regulator of GroEL
MATVPQTESVTRPAQRPRLVFFYSPLSGRCRRVEGFIAQVLQRRRNHDTFDLVRVSVDRRPDLAEKFGIEEVPTICVVEDRKLRRRIVAPRGCRELEQQLEPWLH